MEELTRTIRDKVDYAVNTIQEHRYRAQWELRHAVNKQQRIAVRERKLRTPEKTSLETDLGVYLEELDPQIQDAMVSLYQKGYTTLAAGFWGNDAHQHLDIENHLSSETKQQLQTMGVKVREEQQWDIAGTAIDFWPKEADLEKITQQWNVIVSVLPQTGERIRPEAERIAARRKWTEAISVRQRDKARVKPHPRLFRK